MKLKRSDQRQKPKANDYSQIGKSFNGILLPVISNIGKKKDNDTNSDDNVNVFFVIKGTFSYFKGTTTFL